MPNRAERIDFFQLCKSSPKWVERLQRDLRPIRDHLFWDGSVDGREQPRIGIGRRYIPVRRLLYLMANLTWDQQGWVENDCYNPDCVNPAHQKVRPWKQ